MDRHRFCHYELRTTDVAAARAFYTDVLGREFWGADVSLGPLPERAAARGAPAHWLGARRPDLDDACVEVRIATADVESMADRIVAIAND